VTNGLAIVILALLSPAQQMTAFAPRTDPAFGDARAALSRLVAEHAPRVRGPQHFCTIGYRGGEGANAWVYWREANRLILWQGGAEDDALLHSTRSLDLAADVVATEADIAGSTYRVTRAWVAARLADCAARGDHYTLRNR